jgi:hypothetical protein
MRRNSMKRLCLFLAGFVTAVVFSGPLQAFQHHTEKALWAEIREHGKLKTTIAVTEGIARQLIKSKNAKVNFSGKGKRDIVTKEMIRSVLDGKEKSVMAQDEEHNQEIKLFMNNLDVPGRAGGNERLVLETYKAGKKKFSIGLPDVEVEESNDSEESEDMVKMSFGWKGVLPFLAKSGGALYVHEHKEDTEVWIYVE